LANFIDEVNNGTAGGTASALAVAGNLKGDCASLRGVSMASFTALTESTVGTRCVLFNAAPQHALVAADRIFAGNMHVLTVAEAAALDPAAGNGGVIIGGVASTVEPVILSFKVLDAVDDIVDATLVNAAFAQHPAGTGQWDLVIEDNSGGPALLLTGDQISWTAAVAG